MARHTRHGTSIPHALRDYALLADGERGALIGPRGDIAWMCVPRWDSGAVLSALLGGTSEYVVRPDTRRFTWGGYYESGTLIWRSRWVCSTGIVECREALAFPGDPHTAVVLRRVMAIDRDAQVDVSLDMAAEFDALPMQQVSCKNGIRTLRVGPLHARWSGAAAARCAGGRLRMQIEIPAGEHHDLVLELSDRRLPDSPPKPDRLWAGTEHAWRLALPPMKNSLADRDAAHACAVLRGLTSHTGAMVAAATTALPERADQGRNYDYRYCWIRDQCYAGHALAAAGPGALFDDAVRFVSARVLTDGPDLRPAYTSLGDRVPRQSHLDLPGYPGADPRIGNKVDHQFQLDIFGEALLLLATADRHDRLEREQWNAAEIAAAAIEQRWHEPDAGIWELDNRHWAHSRLICAAGLRAIAARAPSAQSAPWHQLADRLVTDTTRDSLHPSGRWQRAPDDDRIDAALLLASIRGAIAGDDIRSVSTAAAVRRELGSDGYVYRFQQDERPLADAEGAFLLCGFLMALAEHQQGRQVDALRWFERNRAACGSPALFTEEFDVVEHQLRGNLPQAFVHALLLESAHRLTAPWQSWLESSPGKETL